jgi:hypothetical protein
MSDIVERLRQFQADEPGFPPLFSEAAAEIERLKRRIAILEQARPEPGYCTCGHHASNQCDFCKRYTALTRADHKEAQP